MYAQCVNQYFIYINMNIATRLRYAMQAADIETQAELAARSKVPQPTISRILGNRGTKGPETETIRKLAGACRISFNLLNEGIPATEEERVRFANTPMIARAVKIFGPRSERRRSPRRAEDRDQLSLTGLGIAKACDQLADAQVKGIIGVIESYGVCVETNKTSD